MPLDFTRRADRFFPRFLEATRADRARTARRS